MSDSKTKISAGRVGRGELFFIDPENIVVDYDVRGRMKIAASDIKHMAESIKTFGQQTPVKVRRIAGNKVQLVHGYTRFDAIKLLNEQGEKIKVQCTWTDCNDEEAFVSNVVENAHRNQTSPMDDAFNQRRLREQFSYADKQIAELYRCSPSLVSRYKTLLRLPKAIQNKVHDGKMTVEAAIQVADLPPEEQTAVVESATKNDGTVVTSSVRQEKRRKANKKAEANGDGQEGSSPAPNGRRKNGSAPRRTLAEVRTWAANLVAPAEQPALARFGTKMVDFIDGDITDEKMYDELEKLLDAQRQEVVQA